MKKVQAGFTLIELLVVIAIIAILMGFLFPMFTRGKEQALQTQCLTNMRQLGLALTMYADNHEEMLPVRTSWYSSILAEVKENKLFKCPSDKQQMHVTSYGINGDLAPHASDTPDTEPEGGFLLSSINNTAATIILAEIGKEKAKYSANVKSEEVKEAFFIPSEWKDSSSAKLEIDTSRHNGAGSFTFADGHAAILPFSKTWSEGDGGTKLNLYKVEMEP